MGDIGTHAQITAYVVKQLQAADPKAIPEADYTYVELGNFLTDVSQFRDPPAFHGVREAARQEARLQAGAVSGPVGVDAWADGMFGVATKGAKHGWLPEFLSLLAHGLTHQVFDEDGASLLAKGAQAVGKKVSSVVPKHPLSAAEVARVLAERFSQYYPHEHVDFPPMRDNEKQHHRDQPMFRRDKSGLITYLEGDLLALSEELSQLEEAWVKGKAVGLNDTQRRDFLLRLGHCLHAVEDFYFHSNFAELRQLQFVRRKLRRVDLTTPAGKAFLVENLLAGTRLDATSLHLRRLMFRRLRYPVFNGKELSLESSEDGTDILFTGGFGKTDVWHTLGGALEAIEESTDRYASALGELDPRLSHLVLIRLLFSETARRELVHGGDTARAELRDQHAKQVVSDEYPKAIKRLGDAKLLSTQAAARLEEAFKLDRSREEEFKFLPGPGGVFISMLALMQIERDESARQSRNFDGNSQATTIERSANDSSQENVGTHSLLSKDSSDKEPFRLDAVAFASHASAGVATALARRLGSAVPVTQGVDWDSVLHFYLRFPSHPSAHWEEELVAMLRRDGDSFEQPAVGQIKDRPTFPLLGPDKGAEKLAKRRTGTTQRDLEAFYAKFESDPPSRSRG
jgi:hypothetical protein